MSSMYSVEADVLAINSDEYVDFEREDDGFMWMITLTLHAGLKILVPMMLRTNIPSFSPPSPSLSVRPSRCCENNIWLFLPFQYYFVLQSRSFGSSDAKAEQSSSPCEAEAFCIIIIFLFVPH